MRLCEGASQCTWHTLLAHILTAAMRALRCTACSPAAPARPSAGKIEHDERVSGGDEEHDAAGILAGGLQAAKKQMDGLKGMFSSLFGGKGKGKAGEANEKEKVGGRK